MVSRGRTRCAVRLPHDLAFSTFAHISLTRLVLPVSTLTIQIYSPAPTDYGQPRCHKAVAYSLFNFPLFYGLAGRFVLPGRATFIEYLHNIVPATKINDMRRRAR